MEKLDSKILEIQTELNELRKKNCELLEENRKLKTINAMIFQVINLQEDIIKKEVNFPIAKPIFSYPENINCCCIK